MAAYSAKIRLLRAIASGFLVAGAWHLPSCTLGDAPPNCIPGASSICAGKGGCDGHQECDANGNRLGPCICDPGKGLPPIVIEAGPDGRLPNLLGAPCSTDHDCGPLLYCLAAGSKTIFDEGPSNGYCVADCAKDASICTDLDPASTCRTFDDKGTPDFTSDDVAYCTRGCTTGTPPGIEKCFDRPDVACLALGSGTSKGVCIPVCRNDQDCSPRFCDLASGLCADGSRKGTPIGSACSASNSGTCAGFCKVSSKYSECSAYCENGQVGCGNSGDPPYDALCSSPQSTGAWTGGDFGFCRKLCDCDEDCGRTDAVCSPLPSEQVTATGRKGECRSALSETGDPRPGLPCPT